MIKSLVFMMIFLVSVASLAAEHQMIDTLGVSPKGQFVALEEYGYKPQNHTYYVVIKVMNVWKKEYVGTSVQVELSANRPNDLQKARAQAKSLAQEQLSRFGISG